jgi:hypothetical protein
MASVGGPSGAIVVSLQDYLSGRLYADAEQVFQQALDPVVREEMRRAFPDADPASAYNQFKANQKVKADARVQLVKELRAQLAALGEPSTQDQKNEVRSLNALPFRFRTRAYSRSVVGG